MTSLKDREGVTDRAKKEMETKIDDWVSHADRQHAGDLTYVCAHRKKTHTHTFCVWRTFLGRLYLRRVHIGLSMLMPALPCIS
jgi:hypothetical protein